MANTAKPKPVATQADQVKAAIVAFAQALGMTETQAEEAFALEVTAAKTDVTIDLREFVPAAVWSFLLDGASAMVQQRSNAHVTAIKKATENGKRYVLPDGLASTDTADVVAFEIERLKRGDGTGRQSLTEFQRLRYEVIIPLWQAKTKTDTAKWKVAKVRSAAEAWYQAQSDGMKVLIGGAIDDRIAAMKAAADRLSALLEAE